MKREDANIFMKKKENRELWLSEATGSFEKPYKTKYKKGLLCVWENKGDDYVNIYDTLNYYGEVEYEETIEFFNKIKDFTPSIIEENKQYLVAVAGDLSAGAMGDKAELIPIDIKHKMAVKQYLMAQYEKSIELCYWMPNEKIPKSLNNYDDKLHISFERLCDIGIFNNKWQFRSEWKLIKGYEIDEYNAEITELETA